MITNMGKIVDQKDKLNLFWQKKIAEQFDLQKKFNKVIKFASS